MPVLLRDGRSVDIRSRPLSLKRETWRVPNRAGGTFQDPGAAARALKPLGRPSDIYGDVLVTLSGVILTGDHR